MKCAVLVPGSLFEHHEREINDHYHFSGRLTFEADEILAVYVSKKQGSNLPELFRLAIRIFQVGNAEGAVVVAINFGFTHYGQNLHKGRLCATTYDVVSGHRADVLSRGRDWRGILKWIWEIAIEECVPHCFPAPNLAFSSAVVGNEETELGIGHQVQVTVKVLCISAVADDAMPVASLLIEAQGHGVHFRKVFELAGMHIAGSFGLQNLRAFELPILQMSHHEVRHVHR